jgi:hypothetical protein
MLLALVLVVLVHVTLNWISVTWDDVHYGRTGHVQDCGEAGRENIHVYHAQRSWPVSGEITVKRQPLLLSKVAARQCFPGMYLMDLYVTRWICQKGYIFFASLTVRTVQ